jgi:predicted nucleic acid-binding protein
VTAGWLLDNSAWARLDSSALDEDRREEVAGLLVSGRLHTCLPFLLEAGVSARDPDDWDALAEDLAGLPEAPIDAVVERRAREAQHELVRAGLHRAIPIVDLLLAAIAERHDLTLLHYDRDFDRLHESTTLRFRSDWLAAAGTL